MKYRVVDANKAELPINRLCDVLGVPAFALRASARQSRQVVIIPGEIVR
jgi:hypothetical protein